MGRPASEVAVAIVDNVASVVLAERQEIVLVTAGLLAGGQVLLEDVAGVGRTLLAKKLGPAVGGTSGRVQGTADLMPADITGVTVYDRARAVTPSAASWEAKAVRPTSTGSSQSWTAPTCSPS